MTEPTPDPPTPTRVCRKCSVQSTVAGDFCPSCGASFVKKARFRLGRRKTLALIGAVVLVLAIGGGVSAKVSHDHRVEKDRAAAAAARAEAAAQQKATDEANAQETADNQERGARREMVGELEKNIEKDAKGHVREGILDGPIKSASCTATGGGSTDDLTALTGTFDCMAVNKENSDGTLEGYRYAGTIDWNSGDLTWHLGD